LALAWNLSVLGLRNWISLVPDVRRFFDSVEVFAGVGAPLSLSDVVVLVLDSRHHWMFDIAVVSVGGTKWNLAGSGMSPLDSAFFFGCTGALWITVVVSSRRASAFRLQLEP
jgi:hypothetical protein